MLRLFFDGLCEPKNPGGVACYGFIVYQVSSNRGAELFEGYGVASEPGPDSTNNVCEYTGVIKGLEWIQKNTEARNVEVLGDSQVVIRHLTGEYKVRSSRLMPSHQKTLSLLEHLQWAAKWVPREENTVADALSEKAYTEYWMKKTGTVPPAMRRRGATE